MIGLIGAGNMARALARGWGEPVLATDSGSGRAAALVAEVGGEALSSNAELVARADPIVLCHKPYQLDAVAAGLDATGRLVVSVLGATPLEQLRAAWPGAVAVRALPNTPVEVRRGVTVVAQGDGAERAEALFARVGEVHVLAEGLLEAATALAGVTPAYLALVAEAMVDAGVRQGLPAPMAGELVAAAMGGTAELLRARSGDTLAVRREVASPGGSTARGLAALERGGVRAAFDAATEAVVRGS